MKTLGAGLIVAGLLVTMIGYGLYGSVMCNCPAQIEGQALGCHCTSAQQILGHVMVYLGVAVAGSGMVVFTVWWRKKLVFN